MAQASQGQQRSAAQRVGQNRLMGFDMRAPNTKAIVWVRVVLVGERKEEEEQGKEDAASRRPGEREKKNCAAGAEKFSSESRLKSARKARWQGLLLLPDL